MNVRLVCVLASSSCIGTELAADVAENVESRKCELRAVKHPIRYVPIKEEDQDYEWRHLGNFQSNLGHRGVLYDGLTSTITEGIGYMARRRLKDKHPKRDIGPNKDRRALRGISVAEQADVTKL